MENKVDRIVGQYAYVQCPCGSHMVDLFDPIWNDRKLGFYTCNSCEKPLICKGDDGFHYYVGNKVIN